MSSEQQIITETRNMAPKLIQIVNYNHTKQSETETNHHLP